MWGLMNKHVNLIELKSCLKFTSHVAPLALIEYTIMEIVKEELQLENPKDAVCIPPIPSLICTVVFFVLVVGVFWSRP